MCFSFITVVKSFIFVLPCLSPALPKTFRWPSNRLNQFNTRQKEEDGARTTWFKFMSHRQSELGFKVCTEKPDACVHACQKKKKSSCPCCCDWVQVAVTDCEWYVCSHIILSCSGASLHERLQPFPPLTNWAGDRNLFSLSLQVKWQKLLDCFFFFFFPNRHCLLLEVDCWN